MKKPNRLIKEKSPYLLQHAENPVDWYPWGEEAFETARKEDKPIFLSIGYSTCHWCHVMERESFQDEAVAMLLNETFIPVKVDREERPDIDGVYMTACQLLSPGGCGWPLHVVMTPDKKPFFIATYIPRESQFGRLGMVDLIPRIREIWTRQRDKVLNSAEVIASALKRSAKASASSLSHEFLDESTIRLAYQQLSQSFDPVHGGFGRSPKFPTPHHLIFLLRYWKRSGESRALEMVETTLRQMRRGGIYDQVGFGFHRYATDARWFLPHFEKMLSDQAMISLAYTDAYQATGKEEYKRTAEEIFAYVFREMTAPEGAFYSAEDADSEGEEGNFYLWSFEEIQKVLGKKDADVIIEVFGVEKEGNFDAEATGRKTGKNILSFPRPFHELASLFGWPRRELESRIESARQKLFSVRAKRVRPFKDDKILTDWNGLMIAALAKAAWVFGEPKYAAAAERAAAFLLGTMRQPDGRLLHRYRDGEAGIPGNLDDYAFLVWGLIELHQATFETKHLKTALDLNGTQIEDFWDHQDGGFFFRADDVEDLIVRRKEIADGAVPSGNSVSVLNLLKLGRITGNWDLEKKANQIGRSFAKIVKEYPAAFSYLMVALDFALGPSHEVVIVGRPEAEDTHAMREALRRQFLPNTVILYRHADREMADITRVAGFTRNHSSLGGKATAYVCHNRECRLPTVDIDTMLELLNERRRT